MRYIESYQKEVGAEMLDDLLIGSNNLKVIQEVIINYSVKEQLRGAVFSSRNVVYHAIKHFYKVNDVILNWKKIVSFLRSDDRTRRNRSYTVDEIRTLLA